MAVGSSTLIPHSARYRTELHRGWSDLLEWLHSSSIALGSLRHSVSRWARVLPYYIRDRYQQGVSRTLTVHALLSAQRHTHASRHQFKEAWELAWEWRARAPPTTTTPLPPAVAEAIVGMTFALALQQVTRAARTKWLAAVAVLWAGWETLLRPSEMVAISAKTTVFSSQLCDEEIYAVLTIPNAQNRKAFGLQQFVLIEHASVVHLLQLLCAAGSGSSRAIYPGGKSSLQALLQTVLSGLCIPAGTFTLRSFRPGRATQLLRQQRNVPSLQFIGRWGRLTTLHHYLQEAAAALTSARLPATAQEAVKAAQVIFRALDASFAQGIPKQMERFLK